MSIVEKLKANFEGETRDLERKIAKLDGDMDHLIREQRWTKFGAGVLIAFEVFREVAPMVSRSFQAVANAAIDANPHVSAIRNEQYLLNEELNRTKVIIGERLIGNVDALGLKFAGLRGYVSDLNTALDTMDASRGGRLLKLLASGGVVAANPFVAGVLALAQRGGAKLEERGLEDAFVGPIPPDGYAPPKASPPPKRNAADPFLGLSMDMGDGSRGVRKTRDSQGAVDRLETTAKLMSEAAASSDELAQAVDVVAFSFSHLDLVVAQWDVTMGSAMMSATSSLQAHLQEQLRFENLKKASGKRIVQSVLADVGSQAAAEAVFQAAMALGYAFINPAQAAKHATSAVMLAGIAGGAALAYAGTGGSFEQDSGGTAAVGSGRDRVGGGTASARSVAAAAAPGVINYTLTFIYNGPAYYVGPGGLEEFVGSIVPALNDRIDSGELRVA